MAKKRGSDSSETAKRGSIPGGTKFPKVSPRGSPAQRSGNTGGTSPAGGRRPMGSNHQGGAVGKRNSG